MEKSLLNPLERIKGGLELVLCSIFLKMAPNVTGLQ